MPGRGFYYGQISRPDESYRLRCVIVCDLQTSKNEAALARGGLFRQRGKSLVSLFLSSISVSVTPLECKTVFQCVAAGGYMSVCFSVN